MKAYQLKIQIIHSTPPIWRRVIVPAGITFSQLGTIFIQAMGWCGYHMFDFEFPQQKICIMENAEDMMYGFGNYKYKEATDTCINKYMEENKYFIYTYDMGDNWQHHVTIEKIIEDYEYNYPKVIKYKGNCPIEDSGGIYGYYEYIDIINDKSHPEYEEILEWMESSGYPNEYNMEKVNSNLKEACIEECLPQITLKDILESYKKEELLDIARGKNIRGISKCNKEALINKIKDYMLQPEILKSYFLYLNDEEIKLFENIIEQNEKYEIKDHEVYVNLLESDYIGILEDEGMVVSEDVAAAYRLIKNKEFETERRKCSYLLCCLRAAELLYGIVPITVFNKLIDKNSSIKMSADEIKAAIINIPVELEDYVLEDDIIYRSDLYYNDKGLLKMQEDKEFYIPSLDEILEIGTYGYIKSSNEAVRLKQFIRAYVDMPERAIEALCGIINIYIAEGREKQEIFEILNEADINFDEPERLEEFIECINALWNNTRMMANRGFTPTELFVEEMKKEKKSKVINFQAARKKKVYPNEPCPCGSGKKYKNCCKNK